MAILSIVAIIPVFSQGTAGYKTPYESREIIDMPTAGVLPLNSYNIKAKLFREGGIELESNFSFLQNLMLGVSFGGNTIIGNGEIQFQKIPGFNVKFRVFDEKLYFPAIAIGFSNQGNGKWISANNRFENLSPGFYLAISKNFAWALGEVSATGGINYSLEPDKSQRSVNAYGGFEQTLGKYFSLCGEIKLNLDDKAYTNSSANLNLSLKSSIARGITLELQARNILNNNKYMNKTIDRRLSIDVIKYF